MIVEIVDGVGGRSLVVPATQVIVRQDNGTPIAAAAEFGEERCQKVATVRDPADLNRLLADLGVGERVEVGVLQLPGPPRGARLLAGPKD